MAGGVAGLRGYAATMSYSDKLPHPVAGEAGAWFFGPGRGGAAGLCGDHVVFGQIAPQWRRWLWPGDWVVKQRLNYRIIYR